MAALHKRAQLKKKPPPPNPQQKSTKEVDAEDIRLSPRKHHMRFGKVFSRFNTPNEGQKTVAKHGNGLRFSWDADVLRKLCVSESVKQTVSAEERKRYSEPVTMTGEVSSSAELAKLRFEVDEMRRDLEASKRDSSSSSRPVSYISTSGSSTLTAGSVQTGIEKSILAHGEDAICQCQRDHDPFMFNAAIVVNPKSGNECPLRLSCRGKLDTGSEDNWISRKLIASTDLEHYHMKLVEHPKAYQAFGGNIFFPIGQVDINWYLDDGLKRLTSTFLIGDDVPFEMVVGFKLIQQERLLIRPGSALGIRVVDPTAEELAQMQREAEIGDRSYHELTAIKNARKAQAARKREIERQQLRQAITGASGGTSATGSGMPTTSTQP